MIRIRPGRSWRLNPSYASELAGLSRTTARGFDGGQILDVLGIEVDGVDIAAGVGEARVLVAVDELAQALLRIGEGERAAQATIGPGPTELVIEARGEDLLLTLVSLAPPARLVASGLLVDAQKMRQAVLHAARGLLLDLLALSPQLSDARVSQRLAEASAQLAQRPTQLARRWPTREAASRTRAFKAPRGTESLSLQLPAETVARLLTRGEVPHAPLAAHLGPGALALSRKGAPGLVAEGPAFLLLRNLLEQAERLVEAYESGEPTFALRFGPHELSWELGLEEVRAPGWRAAATLPPLRFASLVTQAARAYSEVPLRRAPDDELAADLRDRALKLDRHCRDLQSGDLRRAPGVAPSVPPRAPSGPLARRMRRLVYREAWQARLPDALRILACGSGPLLIERRHELEARDARTGELLWSQPAAPGAVVRGLEIFYSEPGDALVRVEASSGEVRWKRRLRGAAHPARLWPLSRGVLRALPGEGVALVDDAAVLAFRAKLPGGAPSCAVEAPQAIVAALPSFCVGLDPADGSVLWKRRAAVRELVRCGAQVLALEDSALLCLDPQSGKPSWRVEVPQGAHALHAEADAATLLAGGAALSLSLQDGAPRGEKPLPWARHLSLFHEPDALLATGAGGEAARLDGKRWSIAPDGSSALPAQQRRGVVLLSRAQTELYELESGLLLAQLPPGEAMLGDDLSCAILSGGDLRAHRLATHLSLL